tara:strand:+ start:7173 stop:7364 length:192 start_codon:yes stop_codon:yes gene_type:complete
MNIFQKNILNKFWRGGRVVEGARLESVYRGNSIMGSNPILSAINLGLILMTNLMFNFFFKDKN